MPSGHSVQQSAVPVRSGRCCHPSRISLPTSLKSCARTWNNIKQEGCFPIPRTSSHIKTCRPEGGHEGSGIVVEISLHTHVGNTDTQHSHSRQHTGCPQVAQRLQVYEPNNIRAVACFLLVRGKALRRTPDQVSVANDFILRFEDHCL